MAEGMNSYSLADIAAMMRNNEGDGFLNGNGILIILFFLIFGGGFGGGWGNGWGNGGWNNAGWQGSLTRADLNDSINTLGTNQKLDNLTLEVNNDAHNLETAMMTGFNTSQRETLENRYATQNGFCETNRNIDAIRYENAQNTCSIINASNANTQKILDAMCEDRIQGLRDKIVEQSQMLQSAAFQVSQEQQSAALINALRPTPIPAYITASPYQSYGVYGNGNGYGYGYYGTGFYGNGYGPF